MPTLIAVLDIQPRDLSYQIPTFMNQFNFGEQEIVVHLDRGRAFVFVEGGVEIHGKPSAKTNAAVVWTDGMFFVRQALSCWLDLQALVTGMTFRLDPVTHMIAEPSPGMSTVSSFVRADREPITLSPERADEVHRALLECLTPTETAMRVPMLRLAISDYARALEERGTEYLIYLYRAVEALRNLVAGIDDSTGRPKSDWRAWHELATVTGQDPADLKLLTDAANSFQIHARHAANRGDALGDDSGSDGERRARYEQIARVAIQSVVHNVEEDLRSLEADGRLATLSGPIRPPLHWFFGIETGDDDQGDARPPE